MTDRNLNTTLLPVGVAMLILYLGIMFLSPEFSPTAVVALRPILNVLLLFAISFAFYLYACHELIWRSWRNRKVNDLEQGEAFRSEELVSTSKKPKSGVIKSIFVFGILFRLALIFSTPILEVDIYRYLWDGFVTVKTGNPYEFAPLEILQNDYPPAYQIAFDRSDYNKAIIDNLASEARTNGYSETLSRVHFGQYTSPYPPTSQLVFALSAIITPDSSSTETRLAIMKSLLTIFDIGTAWLVLLLLRRSGLPDQWVIAYFWCPLLMKEFANSGHLDSIAIFLTALFVWLCSRAFWPLPNHDIEVNIGKQATAKLFWGLGTGAILALAVGAKIYPLVLAPAWLVIIWKRFGLKSILPISCFVGLVCLINWPMLKYLIPVPTPSIHVDNSSANFAQPTLPKPTPGITAFTKSWEMNDLLFMIAIENIKPTGDRQATDVSQLPWFVFTSNPWRHDFSDLRLGTREIRNDQRNIDQQPLRTEDHRRNEFESAFSFTRNSLLGLVSLILIYCGWQLWKRDTIRAFIEMTFYSLAWFWLLSPTQNPWYWCWALPFLPFVKSKAWYLFAGATLAYYLRFYFESQVQLNSEPLFGTPYRGTAFFDFVVPFFEFGLPLLLLLVTFLNRSTFLVSKKSTTE